MAEIDGAAGVTGQGVAAGGTGQGVAARGTGQGVAAGGTGHVAAGGTGHDVAAGGTGQDVAAGEAWPRLGLLTAGALLVCSPALAQLPPLPDSVGAGSLPSVRAAAAAERLAGDGLREGSTTPPPAPVEAGPEIRLGGFGFPQAGTPAPAPAAAGEVRRAFSFTPSIGVQTLGTDNLYQTVRGPRADLVTTISPGLLVSADTAWLQGVLNYAPNVQLYARGGDQNRVDQRANGQALATLLPGLVYLDMRGATAVQNGSGGIAPESGLVTDRRNRVSTTTAQISPYLLHRFGSTATLQAGYAFQYGDQSGTATSATAINGLANSGLINGRPAFTAQRFTAHELYAVLRSGPDFSRLAWEARADSTFYDGNGVLDGAYRRQASVEGRYAIIRGVSLLAEGGYEQQRYGGTPGRRVDGPVWALGGRLDFADDGRLIVKYGRRDGFDSAYLDASIPIGGRTRLGASYNERLTTSAQRAVDLLTSSSLDAQGNAIDLATGQPAVRSFANSFLGAQGNLLRIRAAAVSVVQSWPRDTFSVSLTQEQQTPVSIAIGGVGYAQRGTSGSFAWAHALSERTTATAFVQYGRFTTGLLGRGDVVSGSVSLAHQLAPRLTGVLQIGTSSRASTSQPGRATQNIVLLSLRQTF